VSPMCEVSKKNCTQISTNLLKNKNLNLTTRSNGQPNKLQFPLHLANNEIIMRLARAIRFVQLRRFIILFAFFEIRLMALNRSLLCENCL
jgi:hypothetical protein